MEAGQAWIDLNTRLDKIDAGLREATAKIGSAGDRAGDEFGKKVSASGATRIREGVGKINGLLATVGVGLSLAAVVTFFSGAVDAASQLEQSVGAVESVLGPAADKVKDFGKGSADSFGLSERAVSQYGAVLGAQLKGMGYSVDAAADTVINLEQRAADMAATFGGTVPDAVEAISALLRGERDTIEKYGVTLKDADVKARILALGLDTSTVAAQKNATAVASLDLFMEATADTAGQFARESDTLAGAQARNAANMENAMARIGDALMPVALAMADWAADVMPDVARAIVNVINAAKPLVEYFGNIIDIFNDLSGIAIPLLVGVLAYKLVTQWQAVTAAAKAAGSASKLAILGPIALIPEVIDLGQHVAMLGVEMREGKDDAEAFAAVWERMDHAFWELPQEAMDDFRETAKALGVDWHDLAAGFIAQNEATGVSLDEYVAHVEGWVDGTDAALQEGVGRWSQTIAGQVPVVEAAAESLFAPLTEEQQAAVDKAMEGMREVPGGVATTLDDGRTVFAASAEALASSLPDSLQTAHDDAVDIIAATPADLAAALEEAFPDYSETSQTYNDEIVGQYTEANRKILMDDEQARIDRERAQADGDAAALDALTAAQRDLDAERLFWNEIAGNRGYEGIEGYATGMDLAKYLVDAQNSGLIDDSDTTTASIVENYANAGVEGPEGFAAAVNMTKWQMGNASRTAAQDSANAMEGENWRFSNAGSKAGNSAHSGFTTATSGAWSWGNNVGNAFADGLAYSQSYLNQKAYSLAYYGTRFLRGESPPKEGPLHEIDIWGRNVGRAWSEGLAEGVDTNALVGALNVPRNIPAGVVVGAMGGVSGMASAIGGGTMNSFGGINVSVSIGTMSGDPQDVDALGRQLAERIRLHLN